LSYLAVKVTKQGNLRGGKKFMGEEQIDHLLLSPGQVAEMFSVDPKTVTRWAKAGKLTAVKTLGGHRRYHADEVRELLRKVTEK